MRILFLSNFYPPAHAGGYTQWCYEVAERLKGRGHTIGVLTSNYEVEKASAGEVHIYRTLHLENDLFYYQPLRFFLTYKRHLRENLTHLRRAVTDFAPDILFIWGMWAMSKTLPALAERLLPSRVVYYLSDYWPASQSMHATYWKIPAQHWFTRLLKNALSVIAQRMTSTEDRTTLRCEHVICVSAAVRDILIESGIPIANAQVIHGGTDIDRFAAVSPNGQPGSVAQGLRLLYAGQLVPHKGVHTAIEAVAKLVHELSVTQLSLTLVGSGHPDYVASLHALVDQQNLHPYVKFHGPVPGAKMPETLGQFDVLLFPSTYEEPLARMTQEAMAAGLAVIGTTTGGTKEILVHGENGLTFAPEDATDLAQQIKRLNQDRDLCRRLAAAGRQTVLERFTLSRMVDQIESYLLQLWSGDGF